MGRRYVDQLQDGESLQEVFLLQDKQLRANRNADLYLLAQLSDKTGHLSALMWNVNEESLSHINAGDYVRVRGKVQRFQGNLQLIITLIEQVPTDQVEEAEFRIDNSETIQEYFAELTRFIGSIEQQSLRQLMELMLNQEPIRQGLMSTPAGVKAHHAYPGGLLEHICTLMKSADAISGVYGPALSRDLLLAGVFLHDIGKLRELNAEGAFSYTDEGQLVGHLVIGVEMLNEAVTEYNRLYEADVPAEILLRLKHMIVSHHGSVEYGSPKLPMTIEGMVLHYLDNIDAKLNEFDALIQGDPNSDSSWTIFHSRLDRKLFKGEQS